jgi:hypothetical protein
MTRSRLAGLSVALWLNSCVAHEGAIEVKNDPFLGDTRTFSSPSTAET